MLLSRLKVPATRRPATRQRLSHHVTQWVSTARHKCRIGYAQIMLSEYVDLNVNVCHLHHRRVSLFANNIHTILTQWLWTSSFELQVGFLRGGSLTDSWLSYHIPDTYSQCITMKTVVSELKYGRKTQSASFLWLWEQFHKDKGNYWRGGCHAASVLLLQMLWCRSQGPRFAQLVKLGCVLGTGPCP